LSTPFRLLLPQPIYEEMLAQAAAELPNECCGLLAGIVSRSETAGTGNTPVARIVQRYPLVNSAHSPREYDADPRGIFEAVRDSRQKGLELLAIYHSHPTTDPVPSRTDLARNSWPGVVSFIISLRSPVPGMKGWWLGEKDFTAAEWELV
jgi:proteasome lid subunit RPN8/RPN11